MGTKLTNIYTDTLNIKDINKTQTAKQCISKRAVTKIGDTQWEENHIVRRQSTHVWNSKYMYSDKKRPICWYKTHVMAHVDTYKDT